MRLDKSFPILHSLHLLISTFITRRKEGEKDMEFVIRIVWKCICLLGALLFPLGLLVLLFGILLSQSYLQLGLLIAVIGVFLIGIFFVLIWVVDPRFKKWMARRTLHRKRKLRYCRTEKFREST